ncbi:MAG: hypothetical protein Q4D61_05855 [Cardiobacteriaceae bacterium]|nr:hypothetical protein [Cardiobacteriaceae bacterium]
MHDSQNEIPPDEDNEVVQRPGKFRIAVCLFYLVYPIVLFIAARYIDMPDIAIRPLSTVMEFLGLIAVVEGLMLFSALSEKNLGGTLLGCAVLGVVAAPVGFLLFLGLMFVPDVVAMALPMLIFPWAGVMGLSKARHPLWQAISALAAMGYGILFFIFFSGSWKSRIF